MSRSSGCTSCGATGSALAGEPSSSPASGFRYQVWSTAITIGQPATSPNAASARNVNALRRLGTSPIGATPARAATSSHHAPAALTSTGARTWRPSAVRTCQR